MIINTLRHTFLSCRSEHELVSFTGVILQHSYRINHEALASGSLFQGPSSKAGATENIVALTVQSLQYPDTIVVYYHFKEGIPLPIGLLPGGVVTLHALRVKSSKSGNVYCINSASSSITVNSLEGVGIDVQKLTFSAGVMPQMLNLSTTRLYGLMQDLIHGCLSRRIVCVRGRFMSVQQAAIQFTCRGCHCTVVDGSCMTSCLQSKPVLKAEARYCLHHVFSVCVREGFFFGGGGGGGGVGIYGSLTHAAKDLCLLRRVNKVDAIQTLEKSFIYLCTCTSSHPGRGGGGGGILGHVVKVLGQVTK